LLLRRWRAAIDRYILSAGPTAANPPDVAAEGEWVRQAVADGHLTVTQTLLRIQRGQRPHISVVRASGEDRKGAVSTWYVAAASGNVRGGRGDGREGTR